MLRDFAKFLREFNIISLAIAFVMGSASTTLVNSLVEDIIMPLLSPLLSGDEWRAAVLELGAINLPYGSFIAELINFIILAFVVFVVATKVFKMESVPKK
jgi:large conductance mechanosensitive channel